MLISHNIACGAIAASLLLTSPNALYAATCDVGLGAPAEYANAKRLLVDGDYNGFIDELSEISAWDIEKTREPFVRFVSQASQNGFTECGQILEKDYSKI